MSLEILRRDEPPPARQHVLPGRQRVLERPDGRRYMWAPVLNGVCGVCERPLDHSYHLVVTTSTQRKLVCRYCVGSHWVTNDPVAQQWVEKQRERKP